jgi:hypothetical protein
VIWVQEARSVLFYFPFVRGLVSRLKFSGPISVQLDEVVAVRIPLASLLCVSCLDSLVFEPKLAPCEGLVFLRELLTLSLSAIALHKFCFLS